MNEQFNGSWTLGGGRWLGVEVRVHVYLPLLALTGLLASRAWGFPARVALIGAAVLAGSVLLHELARAIVAQRVGGRLPTLILGPTGGWTRPELPFDPAAHLMTALAGPTTYLALCVGAACLLVASGSESLVQLLSLLAPQFAYDASSYQLALELTVWVNAVLLVVNLMPIGHCDAASLLQGLLWPLVDRQSAATAVGHLALGGAVTTGALALWLRDMTLGANVPAWYPLSCASVLLLYGGIRSHRDRRIDWTLDIDELDSDDEQWLSREWSQEDQDHAAVVLVEPLQEKQQETLDRKRREREDQEDAQVDHILMRLQTVSFEGLSAEEQAVLKRASRRYRRRRLERPTE